MGIKNRRPMKGGGHLPRTEDQCFEEQPAHADGDEEQEPQESAPATTFPSVTAQKSESALAVSQPPQSGQTMGASASAIERRESNRL